MASLPFRWVDAFTERPLAGNPCAVVFDADGLDDAAMLAIAREMNLSETAFVVRPRSADFAARYFTPEQEIPLAGHPTIATVHALLEAGRIGPECTSIDLELRAGVVRVAIERRPGGTRIIMAQRKPQFLRIYEPSDVLPAFGLSPSDGLAGAAIQTVSTGTPQLMIPLAHLDALRRADLQVSAYRALRSNGDFFSPHLFCLEGATLAGQTFARHFGVPPDTLEDPFTGSATGGMGAYLWRYGLIERPIFVAEQGHWMRRPGSASVEVVGPRDDIETVKVGGSAVTVLRGELCLPVPFPSPVDSRSG